jgi:FKBP-type peptidyl-prolyl cis-trans isomerase (trigger factor)
VRLRRMLVMSEIARVENLGVDEVAIEETINEMLQSAAEDQRDAMRQILMSDSMQAGLRNQVLSDALSKRIIDIAQGIAAPLPLDSEVNEPAAEAAPAAAESSTEANSEEGEAS